MRRVTVGDSGEKGITIHSFPRLKAYHGEKGGKFSVQKVGSNQDDPSSI